MTEAEWSANMRKVLGPHLDVMGEEVQRSWGKDVDPESMLLRWLCQRKNLEVPPVAIRLPKVSDASSSKSSPAKSELRPPNSARSSNPAQTGGRSLASAGALALGGGQGQSPVPDTPKLQLPMSARLPAASSAPLARPGLPAQEGNGYDLAPALWSPQKSSKKSSLENADTTPWARTLTNVVERIASDEVRHTTRSDHLKANNARMHEMMAYMHQELRGQFLSKVPLLSAKVLNAQTQFKLVSCLRPHTFDKGQHIITEGEVGDKLYIVERGTCEVLKKINDRSITVGQLGKGAFFGEIAVLYDMPRTATVRAQTSVIALSLSRDDLKTQLSDEDLDRMRVIARTQVFASMPLLAGLNAEQKAKVAEALKSQKWLRGSILAGQNHITSRVFIVEQGTLKMDVTDRTALPSFMQGMGTDPITLGPGQYFGMRGLLYEAPVGFNITAASDEVHTLSISYEELLDTAGTEHEARQELSNVMLNSMRAYLLRQVPQLTKLAEDSFNIVQSQVQETTFKKWSVILAKGGPIDSVYVLESGKLVEYDGEAENTLEFFGTEVNCPERTTPGECFGTECLSKKAAQSPYTLVALTDVKMLKVPPSAVWVVQQQQRQFISKIPLFAEDVLTKDEQYMLVSKLKPWNFPSGRYIIKEGEIGDMLFVIERGVCDACKTIDGQEVVLAQLKKGAFFGETAVIFDMPRGASVRATTAVTALSLSREDLMATIGADKIDKMKMVARTQVFGGIPILAGLVPHAKNVIARRLKSSTFKKGQSIVTLGAPTDRMYIIEKGSVAVESIDGKAYTLLAGMNFGMDGLIYSQPYSVKAVATSDEVQTLSLTMEDVYATAGTGEQDALARQLLTDFRRYLLKQIPGLEKRTDDFFATMLNHCEVLRFEEKLVVFSQGETVDSIYVKEFGSFQTSRAAEPGTGNLEIYGLEWRETTDTAKAPYTLKAVEDSALIRVPLAILR
eukprot:TRINITY_DN27435_c0_g1_i1.p1 TRINITY_DN27435_c0_g1~~TRINITY_DN27435_c0_g1_i1.p1  ORF type:complete len:993 (-),score=177.83 TRINITY_DN27435_c0_g1_i1:110-2992(-)